MPTLSAPDLICRVHTRKAGVLSALGHELKLVLDRGWLRWSLVTNEVEAELDLASLRSIDVPPADAKKIERIAKTDVLNVAKFPIARFVSSRIDRQPNGYAVHGKLTLHGTEQPLVVAVVRENGRLSARVELHQPDYGIVPYSAMLNTLRVGAEVDVEVSAPETADSD